MKVIIAAQIEVAAERRDEALSAAGQIIANILLQEGCVRYDWAADCRNPELIIVFEEWASQSALEQHFAGPSFGKMNALLAEIGVKSAAAKKYGVDREGSVFNSDRVPTSEFE